MSSASDSSDGPDDPAASIRRLTDAIGLDAARLAERLRFFELGPADEEALRRQQPSAEARVDDIVSQFYEHLLRFPELEILLRAEPGRIEKLQGLQRAYFLRLVEGRFDGDYMEGRLRVGDAHERIGLEPAWYIGAFALFLRLSIRVLLGDSTEAAARLPAVEALIKSVCLDMSLAIDTYIYGGFVDRAAASRMEEARQVAEETLRARQEVERMKDDLTSMVVHDLKNPVNGIAMMVQLALRKGAELPEAQRNYLGQIQRTCREMMRLIQNLLEISKIEEEKMPVLREPIVLAELVDEVAHEYAPVAEQTGRRLSVAVDTGLPAALGDRTLLKRVLVNLVVNAIRHSGSQDVLIEGSAAARAVTLSVVDHGFGIAPEEHKRLFEKFRTFRRSPTEDPSGDTGLGLPFCKLAVERMGGTIALRSASGTTVFAVTLPAHGS
jgi:signal transduction histidine kinase